MSVSRGDQLVVVGEVRSADDEVFVSAEVALDAIEKARYNQMLRIGPSLKRRSPGLIQSSFRL